MYWIANVIEFYLGLQVAYLLIFSLASVLDTKRAFQSGSSFRWIVFIPVYKEDKVILPTVRDLLDKTKNDPPQIVVLADGLHEETLKKIEEMGASYLKIELEKSTKAKSLKKAAAHFNGSGFERVLILDADNRLDTEAWDKIRQTRQEDKAIQLNRSALNTDTPMAYLDTLNEAIGNSIFRKGHVNIGLPSALTGSGMIFSWEVFYDMTHGIDEEMSGEDKFYELWLLSERIHIAYWPDVVVLDEKVSKHQQFSQQRTRWISSQYTAFVNQTTAAFSELLRGNIGYFDKWLQWGFLPKFILLGLLIGLSVLQLFGWGPPYAMRYTVLLIIAFALAIPRERYNRKMLGAILYAPVAMFALIKGILGIKKDSAKTFNVTEKGSDSETN